MPGKTLLRALPLVVAAVSFSSFRLAAQDAPSVAEAAKRAREQKQTAAKPARVVTEDTLKPATAETSTPFPLNASAPPAPGATAATADKQTVDPAEEEAKKKEMEALKEEIKDKKQGIDLAQREIALAQDSFLSNPDHEHDRTGKAKLDAMRSDVQQLQTELQELQAKLAELSPPADTKTPESPKL